jgi:50S ribosomal protein L16 3-hydroxylase
MRYDANMKKSKKNNGDKTLLGGITPQQFLREYWQKKPLMIRGAIPGFTGVLSAEELAGLACEDDVQSRLVSQAKGNWRLEHGPFEEERFAKLHAKNWTLLVQSVNQHLPEAMALLQRFDFIPYARLDDLMVSYAPDGGGVGPHFDSYDVFLLQGQGKRLWRVSQQQDLTLVEGVELKILKNFHTEQEWLLEPGDMLYLPPHVAHWGVAVGDCMTYSIGFRAPSVQELAGQFLNFMQDRLDLAGVYADADLKLQTHPAKISKAMLKEVVKAIKRIQWEEADVAEFLGCYLTEPKLHVVFDKPRSMNIAKFRQQLIHDGIQLSLKSQMLFDEQHCFINGELVKMSPDNTVLMRQLADNRSLPAGGFEDIFLIEKLHEWYLAGYVQFPK